MYTCTYRAQNSVLTSNPITPLWQPWIWTNLVLRFPWHAVWAEANLAPPSDIFWCNVFCTWHFSLQMVNLQSQSQVC